MGEPTAKDLRRSTDRRVVRPRKAIREAFFKLMENQDYHKITIASVAREADIDRKTFYLHYRSVSDLVDEVIRDEAQKIVASCREALRSDGDKGLDVSKLFQSISLALAPDMTRSKRVLQHVSLQDVLDRLEASLGDVLRRSRLQARLHALARGYYVNRSPDGGQHLCGGYGLSCPSVR